MLTELLSAYSNYRLHGGWCLSLGAAGDTAVYVCEVSLKLTQTEQIDILWTLWIFVIYPWVPSPGRDKVIWLLWILVRIVAPVCWGFNQVMCVCINVLTKRRFESLREEEGTHQTLTRQHLGFAFSCQKQQSHLTSFAVCWSVWRLLFCGICFSCIHIVQ